MTQATTASTVTIAVFTIAVPKALTSLGVRMPPWTTSPPSSVW